MGTKLESSLSSPRSLFSYVLMIVALSLDGHAIPCVITRAAPLIISEEQVDLMIRPVSMGVS